MDITVLNIGDTADKADSLKINREVTRHVAVRAKPFGTSRPRLRIASKLHADDLLPVRHLELNYAQEQTRSPQPPSSPSCPSASVVYPEFWPPLRSRNLTPTDSARLYPDTYSGPGPVHQLQDSIAELTMDGGGDSSGRHHGGSRKRRYREDDRDDRRDERPARRTRYEEPIASRLRREILVLADPSPRKSPRDDASRIGNQIANNFDDDQVRGPFLDTLFQLIIEQPLKIPFVAAVVLFANDKNPEVTKEILSRSSEFIRNALDAGTWRQFKLFLRFYACLHSILEGDGIFPLLDELFNRAADQQTVSQEDCVGLELVKIILLTIPYVFSYPATGVEEKARDILEKTEIVASVQHPLEILAEPYHGDDDGRPFGYQSALELLQKQLVLEAEDGWKFSCIPRPYEPTKTKENGDETMADGQVSTLKRHALPAILIPSPVNPGSRPLFPEAYFSLYANQEVETVPRTNQIAASIIRDAVVDTINILDFSRVAVAKYLIDLDHYFAPGTFIGRSVPFDKLREIPEDESTWKPEDVVVDAIFSQLFLLPAPEHKTIYYHSVMTEACKVAPAAIAPTLGRGIRFVYRNLDWMDLELAYRFLDWFTHHLSNFDFRWKWVEWVDDVDQSIVHPKKAFIIAAIDKEIRLSFAKRIRETLPKEYHKLIPEGKFKDTPDFKYSSDQTPYAAEGRQILTLLRKKAPESDIQPLIDAIHSQAVAHGVEPLVASTDAYMTAVCFIGSKSLSHVLSCIERCKERLLAVGPQSEAARLQIIESVVNYWRSQSGIAVNIVDKLLNYTIVTPDSVIAWALGQKQLGNGAPLAEDWRYEMVSATVGKVTNRVRQIVGARVQALKAGLQDEQVAILEETLVKEREAMRTLFGKIDDAVNVYSSGSADAFIEGSDDLSDGALDAIKAWAGRWGTTFRRRAAVEETLVGEGAVALAVANAQAELVREEAKAETDRQKRALEAEATASAENGANGHGGDKELDVADDDIA